jgi:hypothetical protein
MINLLRGAAWLMTLAILLRLSGYRPPFLHHLEHIGIEPGGSPGLLQPTVEPAAEDPPQQLPPEDPIAADFQTNFWPSIP